MSDGKWLHGLRQDMPVVAAARHVLLARLAPVRDRLPQAVFHADEDPEHVHQLRVSTRRAGAALRIFAACLPAKVYDKVRKKLRAVRRAAGAARDWDVFLDFLAQRQLKAPSVQQPGLDLLLGVAQGARLAAQQVLVQATQHPPLDVDALLQTALAALKMPMDNSATYSLRDMAVPLLTEQLCLLDQAAKGDLHNYEHLHQVRIRGKRLRYAMEVFAGCFGISFQEKYYPAVEEMQEILGQANDSHVAEQRLAAIRSRIKLTQPSTWGRYQPGIDALLRYHRRALPQKRKLFLTWWRDWQQSGAEEAFASLLKS
ncbi:MAG TPA: CHAD domain-containing protein [Gemmataceae bacterium]|nr:CHAD domain-containing protein [Gemmataceae bacterium]